MGTKPKCGWLTKQGAGGIAGRKNWKKRWFALAPREQTLTYFAGQDDVEPKGVIALKDCVSVKSADEETGKENSFSLNAGDRTYFFVADTPEDKLDWVSALAKAILLRGDVQTAVDDEDAASSPALMAAQAKAATKAAAAPSADLSTETPKMVNLTDFEDI